MIKRTIPILLLVAILIAGCQSPSSSDTDVQTRVAAILTDIPTNTPFPATATATVRLPTVALPTATEEPTETPTEEPPLETPTNTPEPGVTFTPPLPTNTLLPSPTSPAGDPRVTLGAATWTDPMDNGNYWPVGADEFTSLSVAGGEMTFTALSTTNGWRLASTPSLTNFYLEFSGRMTNCKGMDSMGLIFRVPNLKEANRGYLFGITCDGTYYLKAWDGIAFPEPTMTQIVYPHSNKAIVKGADQTNRIGVLASGSSLKLYVNGVQVHEITDETYNKGYFGIFINPDKSTNLTAKIDEISYWQSR